MSKFILGKKIGMMEIFDPQTGEALPVTVVSVPDNYVVQIKTKDKDGYWALQLGCDSKNKLSKPLKGHLKDLPNLKYLREWKVDESEISKHQRGEKITVDIFEKGEKVDVSGISKGRGFAGVVKRHHFKGGPKTHGQKHSLRRPGSIGATTPQKVIKGTKMAGQMGNKRVTIKNLKIVEIDKDKNLIFLKGALPGFNSGLVEIKSK